MHYTSGFEQPILSSGHKPPDKGIIYETLRPNHPDALTWAPGITSFPGVRALPRNGGHWIKTTGRLASHLRRLHTDHPSARHPNRDDIVDDPTNPGENQGK